MQDTERHGESRRKANVKNTIRIVLLIIFSAMFLFSAGMLIYQGLEYKRAREVNDEARDIIGLPDMSNIGKDKDKNKDTSAPNSPTQTPGGSRDTGTPEGPSGAVTEPAQPGENDGPTYVDPYEEALLSGDLGAVQALNSDVIGWIYVTDTGINYPIIYYKDNDYYLRRSWRGTYSIAGTIFMECMCSPDFSNFNTIIYGHRMNDSTMFGDLKNYTTRAYRDAHPDVYIMTNKGVEVYEIYAAYEVSTSGMTYRVAFPTDKEKQEFIDFSLKNSVFNTGIVPTVDDNIITLSTCPAYGFATRWVVQAVKRG